MQEMGVKDVSRVFNLGNWKGEIASLSTYCVLDTILWGLQDHSVRYFRNYKIIMGV